MLSTGGGFCSEVGYFYYAFPEESTRKSLHISALEIFNILVGLRVMLQSFKGKTVRVFCDNLSSVLALQSGKVKDGEGRFHG